MFHCLMHICVDAEEDDKKCEEKEDNNIDFAYFLNFESCCEVFKLFEFYVRVFILIGILVIYRLLKYCLLFLGNIR